MRNIKIRIKCEIEIKEIDVHLKINLDTFEAGFEENYKGNDLFTWNEVSLNTELPTLETIQKMDYYPMKPNGFLTFCS